MCESEIVGISESEADFTAQAGLGLIGQALARCTDLSTQAARAAPSRSDATPHRDVLACPQLAYNLLRRIGRIGLLGPHAPPRRKAKRRRVPTVMQELMYMAARLIRTARRLKLAFGWGCPALPFYRRLYGQLAGT